jgi:hypothetical protein
MFFSVNNQTYSVKFMLEGKSTIATLYKVDGDNGLLMTGIFGTATLYYLDKFDKKKGRKEALADLLINMELIFNTIGNYKFSKEDRTKIWEEYFRNHKK